MSAARAQLVALVTLALAVIRIAGVTSGAYQAAAHIWVGGLFVGWFTTRKRALLALWVLLVAVELACFAVKKFAHRGDLMRSLFTLAVLLVLPALSFGQCQTCVNGRCTPAGPGAFLAAPPAAPSALTAEPVGTPPGADFEWRSLPGIGYGWVHKSVKAEMFGAGKYDCQCPGGCNCTAYPGGPGYYVCPRVTGQPCPVTNQPAAIPLNGTYDFFQNGYVPGGGCANGSCSRPAVDPQVYRLAFPGQDVPLWAQFQGGTMIQVGPHFPFGSPGSFGVAGGGCANGRCR